MNCYDCHLAGRTSTAIGLCHECGAGLCGEHVRVSRDIVHGNASPGLVTRPTRARTLACPMCHGADAAE